MWSRSCGKGQRSLKRPSSSPRLSPCANLILCAAPPGAIDALQAALQGAGARVTALEAALKPFAKAAEDCDVGDDIRIGVVKPADVIWESAAAASITFGHLNTAAQALSRSTEKNDG